MGKLIVGSAMSSAQILIVMVLLTVALLLAPVLAGTSITTIAAAFLG